MKISGIYKITNTITGDFYIGSSKDVKKRWAEHKCQSKWNECPNNPLYQDMQKYGVDKFAFEVLEVVEPEELKEAEQKFIETLKPTYNRCNAKGLNVERRKETHKKYNKKYEKSDKRKKYKKEYNKEYHKTDKFKEYQREYQQSDKRKKANKEFYKKHNNQLCCYNGELLTLCALSKRFNKTRIEQPQIETKKYLLNKDKDNIKEYQKSDKFKEYQKSDEYKKHQKEFYKEYNNQLCCYNGELLTLCALSKRFSRAGIPHPQIEAKKYLLNKDK